MKEIELTLTTPCLAHWNEMTETNAARFCDRCEKTVYDLSDKSDSELLAFFKDKQKNVCVRLIASQLNRPLARPVKNPGLQWLFTFALLGAAIGPSHAQSPKPVVHDINKSTEPLSPNNSTIVLVSPINLFSGTVIDSATSKPIAGVKLRQVGFQNVLAVTDLAGKFELNAINVNTKVAYGFELNGVLVASHFLQDKMTVKIARPKTIWLGGVVAGSSPRKPIYIVYSGNKNCELNATTFALLSPDWVEKIDVMEASKAIATYGKKATNGVVLIGIKKAFANRFHFSKEKQFLQQSSVKDASSNPEP